MREEMCTLDYVLMVSTHLEGMEDNFSVASNCDTLQLTAKFVHATRVFVQIHSQPPGQSILKDHLMYQRDGL